MLDRDGTIISWNSGAEALNGYSAEEALGKDYAEFFTPEDRQAGRPARELLAAAEGRTEFEGWRLRKDGSRFWANVVLCAVNDDAGKLCGFVKVTRDFTDRHAREEARVRRASEEALRAQRTLLMGVKRSLETSLVAMRVHLQTLNNTVESITDDAPTAKLQMLDWALERMARTIDRVVSLAESTNAKLYTELEAKNGDE